MTSPARFGTSRQRSTEPTCSGIRAPAGSTTAARTAAMIMASANIPVTTRDAIILPRLVRGTVEAHLFGDRRGGSTMPDFFDQAKKLASEHEDLVDKGLDQA